MFKTKLKLNMTDALNYDLWNISNIMRMNKCFCGASVDAVYGQAFLCFDCLKRVLKKGFNSENKNKN
jgi:hypothetical protein